MCVSSLGDGRDRDSLLMAAPPRCPRGCSGRPHGQPLCPHRHTGPCHVPRLACTWRPSLPWPAGTAPPRVVSTGNAEAPITAPSLPARPALAAGSGGQRPAPCPCLRPTSPLKVLTHATSPVSPSLASPVPLTPLVLSVVPAPVAERGGHILWALPSQPLGCSATRPPPLCHAAALPLFSALQPSTPRRGPGNAQPGRLLYLLLSGLRWVRCGGSWRPICLVSCALPPRPVPPGPGVSPHLLGSALRSLRRAGSPARSLPCPPAMSLPPGTGPQGPPRPRPVSAPPEKMSPALALLRSVLLRREASRFSSPALTLRNLLAAEARAPGPGREGTHLPTLPATPPLPQASGVHPARRLPLSDQLPRPETKK